MLSSGRSSPPPPLVVRFFLFPLFFFFFWICLNTITCNIICYHLIHFFKISVIDIICCLQISGLQNASYLGPRDLQLIQEEIEEAAKTQFFFQNKKREKNLQDNPAVHYFSKWFSQSQMEKKSEAAKSSTCWKTFSSLSKNEVVPTRYSRKIPKIKTGKSTHKLSFLFQFLLKIWLFGSSKEFGSKVSRFQVLILRMIRRASLISVMLRYLCNCYLFIFLFI